MILLDTTVLMYAVGQDHPLREPCRRMLQAHARRVVQAATTIHVVQEFAHVYARRRTRSDAVVLAKRYAVALPLLATEPDDLLRGLELYGEHQQLRCSGAVLAAVALNQGLEGLVSADRAFGTVAGLRWIDPAGVTPPS